MISETSVYKRAGACGLRANIYIAGGEHAYAWQQGEPVVAVAFARVLTFLWHHPQPTRS